MCYYVITMKQTQTLENFHIYENGELQQPNVLERTADIAGNVAVTAVRALGASVGRVVGECATAVSLSLHDAQEGTQLHAEWCAKRRAERVARIRSDHLLD